jgi:hypothetical protein
MVSITIVWKSFVIVASIHIADILYIPVRIKSTARTREGILSCPPLSFSPGRNPKPKPIHLRLKVKLNKGGL